MNQTRIQYIDVASGILILWVMAFHAMNVSKVFGGEDVRVVLPYLTFSMPWFYYKSGQFFKSDRGVAGIKKDYRKFILPYLKWGAIGYIIYLGMHAISGDLSWQLATTDAAMTFYTYGYIPVNVPTWFILSLFLVRLISYCLLKWNVPPVISMLGGIAIGFLFHWVNCPDLPFLIANVAMGITFFMMGYRFSGYETRKWLWALCTVGYLCFLLFGCSIVGHHRNILLVGHFLVWPVFAYCGIVAFNNLCRCLSAVGSRFLRPITFIGENAMTLLVAHALIYMPVIYLSPLSPWETVGIVFVGYVVILLPLLWWKKK